MIAAVALQAVEFVGNRQRREHRDFLRIHRRRRIRDGVHLFVHVLRDLLHVFHIQLALDGVGLPEYLHFHRPAHEVSARPYPHNTTSAHRINPWPQRGRLREAPFTLFALFGTVETPACWSPQPAQCESICSQKERLMATKPRRKKSPAALQHPIRVVPLHRPEAARVAAAVAPQLTYRGGPLLTAVEVFTVFWGVEWKQAPQIALVTNLNLFFDYILMSALMDQLGEYSVPGKNIGHGKRTGTAVLTSPAPNTSVQDSEIQQLLQQEIAAKNIPAPSPNSL